MRKLLRYFIIGTILWFVVDFTTTEAIRNPGNYYSVHMPALLIFYLGYPLLFSYLIYKKGINGKKLFLTNIIAAFLLEAVVFDNVLLRTFPLILIGIPALIGIYSLLTFVPKWIVDKEIVKNKWKLIIMIFVYILISLASLLGGGSTPD